MKVLGECDCNCHDPRFGRVIHIVPCCQQCPSCKKRWKFGHDVEKCRTERLARYEKALGRTLTPEEIQILEGPMEPLPEG